MSDEGEMVNALSIDVEDYFHANALSSAIGRDEWEKADSRVERNTRSLIESFDTRGIRATFFVLGWVAERHPGIVRDIVAGGHEVASHGYSHKLVYTQSRAEFREETRRSKAILEDLAGTAVTGYRAASFSITPDVEWAIDELIDAGFEYDSSLYPVSHDVYGDRTAPRYPYWREGTKGGLVEFPLSTLALPGIRVPVGGGGYFRLYPYWFLHWSLRRINGAEGKPFVFYLHPWEIDVDQPRLPVKGLSRFRHYNNLDKSQERLDRLLDSFRFDTCRAVLESYVADEGLTGQPLLKPVS